MGSLRVRQDWSDLAAAAAAAASRKNKRDLFESLVGEDNEWQDTKVWEEKPESIHELENQYLGNQKSEESEGGKL